MRKGIQVLIIIGAIALIVMGLFHNEFTEVIRRGNLICFECIGIG